MPSLTIMTLTNAENAKRGRKLLDWEAEKIQFLSPKTVLIDNCESYSQYNSNVLFNLPTWFDSDFVLITQFDARIVNPLAWTNDFFDYDYAGAPWIWRIMNPQYMNGSYDRNCLVGNGGFSLRSRRLCELLAKDYKDKLPSGEAEDVFICQHFRNELESQGIKFAPYEVAERFSVENQTYSGQFGAHCAFIYNDTIYNMKEMADDQIDRITATIGYSYCI